MELGQECERVRPMQNIKDVLENSWLFFKIEKIRRYPTVSILNVQIEQVVHNEVKQYLSIKKIPNLL